jgi:hypothetical protein
MRLVGIVVEFGVGALIGTVLDQIHVRRLILMYPRIKPGKQARWVPLLFGSGTVIMGHMSSYLIPAAAKHKLGWPTFAWLLGTYLITAEKRASTGARAAILLLLLLIFRTNLYRKIPMYACTCALLGCLTEYSLVKRGWFHHLEPDVAQLPLWLPVLYLHAAPAIAHAHNLAQMYKCKKD